MNAGPLTITIDFAMRSGKLVKLKAVDSAGNPVTDGSSSLTTFKKSRALIETIVSGTKSEWEW